MLEEFNLLDKVGDMRVQRDPAHEKARRRDEPHDVSSWSLSASSGTHTGFEASRPARKRNVPKGATLRAIVHVEAPTPRKTGRDHAFYVYPNGIKTRAKSILPAG
jgi:hypothetical protein